MALHHLAARRSWGPSGSHWWLLGGSEDPWLCVTDFGQVCLCQSRYEAQEKLVNSGMYVNWSQSRNRLVDDRLGFTSRPFHSF